MPSLSLVAPLEIVKGDPMEVALLLGNPSGVTTLDLTINSGDYRFTELIKGDAAAAAGKDVSPGVDSVGKLNIIVLGINDNPIGEGELALIKFNSTDSIPGPSSIAIERAAFSDSTGVRLPVDGLNGASILVKDDHWPFVLRWDALGPEYVYVIYFSNTPGGPYVQVDSVSQNVWQIPRRYTAEDYFSVSAVHAESGAEGDKSDEVRWDPPPPAPTVPKIQNLRIEPI